jgi:hypothetical protein
MKKTVLFLALLWMSTQTTLPTARAAGISLAEFGQILGSRLVSEKTRKLMASGYELKKIDRIGYSRQLGDGDQLEVTFERYPVDGPSERLSCLIAVLPLRQLSSRFVVCPDP